MEEKITRTNQSADKIFDVVETMVRYGAGADRTIRW